MRLNCQAKAVLLELTTLMLARVTKVTVFHVPKDLAARPSVLLTMWRPSRLALRATTALPQQYRKRASSALLVLTAQLARHTLLIAQSAHTKITK
jgi:hypothetical protein